MKRLLLIGLFLLCAVSQAFAANESKYDAYILNASSKYGVSASLIKAIIKQESAFRNDIGNGSVTSSAGAIGAMQLMPGTARQMGFTPEQMKDPASNIMAGAKYLKFLMGKRYIGNNPVLVMAAYNAGPGSVAKYGGVPPYKETVNYVRNASKYYARYAGIPPIDIASVPSPSIGTIPGGGKGRLPININLSPRLSANSGEILNKFENYIGVSATTLEGFFRGLLIALALFFAGVQILFFWSDAVTRGGNGFEDLFKAFMHSSRTLLVVIILYNFIAT